MYIVVMSTGFLSFGSHTSASGFVLNSYPTKNIGAQLARVALSIALLSSYPLAFASLRDRLYELFGVHQSIVMTADHTHLLMTAILLSFVTLIALNLYDPGVVMRLAGRVTGTLLVFILPAIMNIRHSRQHSSRNDTINIPASDDTIMYHPILSVENSPSNPSSYRKNRIPIADWIMLSVGLIMAGEAVVKCLGF